MSGERERTGRGAGPNDDDPGEGPAAEGAPDGPGDPDEDAWDPDAPFVVEVEDVLDLHTFAPREVGDLVRDWLDACVERGWAEVRVIHGKGTGTLRRRVHAILDRHPAVASYVLAPEGRGGWGATIVRLRPRPP